MTDEMGFGSAYEGAKERHQARLGVLRGGGVVGERGGEGVEERRELCVFPWQVPGEEGMAVNDFRLSASDLLLRHPRGLRWSRRRAALEGGALLPVTSVTRAVLQRSALSSGRLEMTVSGDAY